MGASMSQPYQTTGLCTGLSAHTSPPPAPSSATKCSLVPVFPTPQRSTCGLTGYLSRPNLQGSWIVSNEDSSPKISCITSCFTLETCLSMSYDAETRQCQLFTSLVNEQKPRKSRSGAVFYEPECFAQECDINEAGEVMNSTALAKTGQEDDEEFYCGRDTTVQLTDPGRSYHEHTYFPVRLPFPMQIYGARSDTAYMSVNGYISLSSPFMTHAHPHNLPYHTHLVRDSLSDMPSVESGLPEHTVCALWIEQSALNTLRTESTLQIPLHSIPVSQSMQYTITGSEGKRKATFKWNTSQLGDKYSTLAYSMEYDEEKPGVWTMRYADVKDAGETASVGAQGSEASGLFTQLASGADALADGTSLVFDSNQNTFWKTRKTEKRRGAY